MLLVLCPVSDMVQYIYGWQLYYVSSYTCILYLHISMYMHTCTLIYIMYVMYRSRVYWRTVPRLRSGLRTRPSDGGGSIRGTRMGQTRKRRRRVGRRRQGKRRHPRRTDRIIWSLLLWSQRRNFSSEGALCTPYVGCWCTGSCHGWVMPQVSSPHFTYILHMCTVQEAWDPLDWNTCQCNISSGHGL